jgi:signal transduction histidine kinase
MIRLWLRPAASPGRLTPPVTRRAGATVLVLLALATLAAQAIALSSPGSRAWAANLAWTLAGVVTLAATLTAGMLVTGSRSVREAWLLYAAGAACWIAGALIRDSAALGHAGAGADLCWLAFPVFCIVSFARRVPRPYIYVIFLLDAIPVVLLVLAIIWTVQQRDHAQPFVILFPGLYVLLAANAIQMAGMHRDLRRIPATVLLFTLGFCTLALASLFWVPMGTENGSALARWTGALWTLGLLLISSAALVRSFAPSAYVTLMSVEKESGPHALPAAVAVLGLIVLLTATPRPGILLRAFLLVAAIVLLARVYLVRRQDVQLVAEVVRSRNRLEIAAAAERTRAERLRVLADATSRLKSLILDELLQAFCDGGRTLLGASYAAFGLTTAGCPGFTRFVAAGPDQQVPVQMGGSAREARPPGAVLPPAHAVRLAHLTRRPELAGFPPGQPPMEGFLGVPVAAGNSTHGVLYLAGKHGGFSEDDEALAEMLAANGGHAIANAELYAESQAQQELLTSQNERLRELDRLKDEFIALVSHELRTPLTSIIGYVGLISEEDVGALNADQRNFAEVIERNAQRLLRLVGDLLFLSRIQSGKMAMEFRDTDITEIAARAVEENQPEAERKHIDLVLSATAVPRFSGDPTRLAQLLDNLISNALKFTPDGGKVEVTVAAEQDQAVIAVTDTGIGIPAADRERIFERFFRTENATRQAIPGTGLGLTITKAIVEAHHGTIAVDSEEGRGTTFRIRLPLPPPAAGTAGPAAWHGRERRVAPRWSTSGTASPPAAVPDVLAHLPAGPALYPARHAPMRTATGHTLEPLEVPGDR